MVSPEMKNFEQTAADFFIIKINETQKSQQAK